MNAIEYATIKNMEQSSEAYTVTTTNRTPEADTPHLSIRDDGVYSLVPVPGIHNVYTSMIVMDKSTFKECYRKWILEEDQS